jgi:hypothetical protein
MRRFNESTRVSEKICIQAASMVLVDAATNVPLHGALTQSQKAAMYMSPSPLQHQARAWMERYFSLCGDYQPNSNEEIHLDPIEKLEIHEEYVKDVLSRIEVMTIDTCSEYLCYSAFLELWNNCFP